MKSLLLIAILGLLNFRNSAIAQSDKDRQEVSKVANEVGNAFFENRMKDLAACFADSSIFITVDGLKLENKHDIIEGHSLLAEIIDTTVSKPINRSEFVRFIRKDIAIVYNSWDGLTLRGQIKSKPQSGYLTTVLEKKNGKWLIVSSTNSYNYQERPDFDFKTYDGKQVRKMIDKMKGSNK